jgi:hypothetical protein
VKRVHFRLVLVISGLIALVIIYAVLWARMISDPAERTGADFITFYSAGRIMLSGQAGGVYDLQAQVHQEEAILGFSIQPADLNPFVNPPFILPLLAGVAWLPYVPAFYLWAFLMLFLYAVSIILLLRVIPASGGRAALFLGMLLFYPIFVSVLNGQDTALLLLGGSVWLYGLLKGDDRMAGLGLAMMSIRPHITLALALPFLFKRRKVWWWFLLGAAVLALASLALVGFKGVENFLGMLSVSAGGADYKINEHAMVNLLGLLRRLAPGFPAGEARLAAWVVYACANVFLCVVWRRSPKIGEKHIGLAVLVALFVAPHLHYHDLALLLIPITGLIAQTGRAEFLDGRLTNLLPLGLSWLLIASNPLPLLKFNFPILLEAALFVALWYPSLTQTRQGRRL